MKRKIFLFAAMTMGLALASCTSDGTENSVPATVEGDVQSPTVSQAPAGPFRVYNAQANWPLSEEQKTQMMHVNDFSLRLFQTMRQEGKSNIFSPLSLAYAMSMTGLGCDGTPLKELNKALGLPDDDTTTLHDLMASLMLGLPKADDAVKLYLANAFYMNSARDDVQLNPDFQQALRNTYKADCETLDFNLQSSADHINQWCSRQTNGFIPKVFEQLRPDYISYLLNALYFKGDWTMPFYPDFTSDGTFTNEDGTTSTLPMMVQAEIEEFPYAEDDIMQALRLSFAKGSYGMTFLLPRKGHTVGDILDALSAKRLAALDKEMQRTPVYMQIPRFETNQNTQLVKPMRQMGLNSWFDDDSIMGIVQNPDGTPHGVYIAEAFQVARIKVNEKGTEAGAVTVFGFTDKAMSGEPNDFFADHPFVYLITERSSGAVLFVGTYHGEPASSGTETGIRPVHM